MYIIVEGRVVLIPDASFEEVQSGLTSIRED